MRTEISIYDFDEVLGDVVLMRGMDYYENGHIISFDVFDDEVTAVVSGYDDYNVKMYIDDKGNVLSHYCNCPYDMGEYCKHEVAVMYALRKYFKTHTKKKVDKKELKNILKEQSVDTLAEILYDLACSDEKLRNRLCIRFKEKTDTAEKCINLVRKYVDMYHKEDGINVEDTDELMEGIYIAIDKAEDIRENNPIEAVRAYIGIIDLISSLEFYEDDYYDRYYYNYEDGDLSEDVMYAIDDLCDKIELFIGSKYSNDIFKIVYNKTAGNVYSIYYNLCVEFCDSDEKRKLIEKLIADLDDEKSRIYFEFELLKKLDNNKVNDFINKHLDDDYFRSIAIRNAFKDGDFERVINLEDTAPKKDIYSGDRRQWKMLAMESYEKLSRNDKAKEYIMFFINIGNDEYIEKYKKLCTDNEWTEVRKSILMTYHSRYKDKYVKLLISENMIDELFNYCSTNKNTIFKLYENFKEKYNDEAKSLFYSEIMKEADKIYDRTSYRYLCDIIKKYGDKYDKEGMLRIINELRITQKRRPAFIDELNKIS